MSAILLLFWACGPSNSNLPMLEGSITPQDQNVSGTFYGYKAFGFDNQGLLVVYISSNENATCTTVGEYLSSGREPYDPVEVFSPGTCNMLIKIGDYTSPMEAQDDRMIAASSAINCAMGEGAFEYDSSASDDRDFFWTGRWWAGFPTGYSWKISGDRDSSYQLEINMSEYEGSFPYEEFDRYAASGSVQGTVDAEVCTDLGTTGLF